ncbi:hypothetical protein LEMLEM_LOCUS2983 [Lemmus lemmus]
MPRSRGSIFVIFASWPWLHLRLAAEAPSWFHCRGPIFIPLPRLYHRSVLLPRLYLRFTDRGSIFILTTVAGDGFEAD